MDIHELAKQVSRECATRIGSIYDPQLIEPIIEQAIQRAMKEEARSWLREFSHFDPWGTREAVCDRIRLRLKESIAC